MAVKKPGEGATAEGYHHIEPYLRCEQEFLLARVRKVSAPQTLTPQPLAVGLGFHAGRDVWFSSGFKSDTGTWRKVQKAIRAELEAQPLPATAEAEQMTLKLLQEYIQHWGMQPLPKVVGTEYMLGPAALGTGITFKRTARLDDVSTYPGGGLWIGEVKTGSSSIGDIHRHYLLHGQPLLQALLWKRSVQGETLHGRVRGVMLDVVKKGYGNKPSEFARIAIDISDWSLEWFERDLVQKLARASMMSWSSRAERNTTACVRVVSGKVGVDCPYKDLCKYGRSAANKYVLDDGKSMTDSRNWADPNVAPWE